MIDDKIDICFLCGHNFSAHKIYTQRKGVQRYKTMIRCNVGIGEEITCNCQAGFTDLNMTLTYLETDTG